MVVVLSRTPLSAPALARDRETVAGVFTGRDLGAENWVGIVSLVETCKLNAVDPLVWMTDTLTRLVNLWPASRIDELMPRTYTAARA
jgi:hypothetical protein